MQLELHRTGAPRIVIRSLSELNPLTTNPVPSDIYAIYWVFPENANQLNALRALYAKCKKILSDVAPDAVDGQLHGITRSQLHTLSPAAVHNIVIKIAMMLHWVEYWGTTHTLSTVPMKTDTFHSVIARCRQLPSSETKVMERIEFPAPPAPPANSMIELGEETEIPHPVSQDTNPNVWSYYARCPRCLAVTGAPCATSGGRSLARPHLGRVAVDAASAAHT